jgi:predicted DNA-binding transcriptional regulator AlpA
MSDKESAVLTDPHAANYIGMSESWLRQSRVNGNPDAPPFIKIGRAVRYLKTDLEEWLRAHRHPPSTPETYRKSEDF